MHQLPVERLEGRALLAAISFTIDSAQSFLTVAARGHVDHVGDVKLKAQSDGLDTAQLQGTVVADVTSKGVRFNGGSSIDAIAHSGAFDPGNESADLAVKGKIKKFGVSIADLNAAIRDLELDVVSTSRKKLGNKRRFDARDSSLKVTTGALAYDLNSRFGDADGSRDLAGLTDTNASTYGRVSGATGARYLWMPINIDYARNFDNGDATFNLTGIIVAKEVPTAGAQSLLAPAATPSPQKRTPRVDVSELI